MNRVLIVDDDRSAAEALRTLLEMDGYEAIACDDSTSAIRLLRRERFDAIVTDLEMPGAHGNEVTRAARSSQPQAPIIIVTAYANSPASATALALGARCVFPKPLDYEAFKKELDTCVTSCP